MDVLKFGLLGLGPGAMYALMALGLIVIYRGSRVLNLAHGGFAMVGAIVLMETRAADWPVPLCLVAAVLVTTLVAVITYVLAVQPVREAGSLVRLASTLGVLIILQSAAQLKYGSLIQFTPPLFKTGSVPLPGDLSIGYDRLVLVGVACVLTFALWYLYKHTLFGIATTASAENAVASAALGHSPKRIGLLNWIVGGALAGLGGALLVPVTGLNVTNMTLLVIVAFAAALLAGLKSFPIALAAGLALGVGQAEISRYLSYPGFTEALPLLVIALVLTFRGLRHPERGDRTEKFPALGSGRIRIVPVVVIAGALIISCLTWMSVEWTDALTVSATVVIVALSLVVVTGYAGQISLAQMAMAGAAGYVSARLIAEKGWPFEVALAVGIIGSALVGAVISLPALRVRAANLAVITLALGVVLDVVVFGQTDTVAVGTMSIFGFELSAIANSGLYAAVVLAIATLLCVGVAMVRRRPLGRRFIAIRSSERGAEALGINVAWVKITAFALASAIAGIGGVLSAYRFSYISFSGYDPLSSISVLVWTLVGGVGFVLGAIVAAFFAAGGIITPITDSLGEDAQLWVALVGGFVLVANLVFAPDGIAKLNVDAVNRVRERFAARKAKAAPATVERVAGPSTIQSRKERMAVHGRADGGSGGRANPDSALDVSGISVAFGGVQALEDVSLQVRPGEIVGLIGPNGAGKTTLVDVITGFTQPDSGTVTFGGEDISSWPVYKRARAGLGRSFQGLESFDDMTVAENLLTAQEAGATGSGGRSKGLSEAARAAMTALDLEDLEDVQASTLAFGVRRLLGVARVIASNPSVVLLDEPAAGVSDTEAEELADVLRFLRDDWGLGIVLIEHNVGLVRSVSDRVVVVNRKVLAVGPPEEVLSDSVVSEAFLGTTAPVPDSAAGITEPVDSRSI
jgi:sulfate-transporting ATPase